jgi:serine/threonine-protein kinase
LYPQVFGKYVLERELSRGGMARVLLATLRGAGGFEKRLVVKQIRDELAMDQAFIRRLVDEAKTTVALAHPNIVPVYELGVEQGTYFIAMELVEGVSIAELLGSGASKRPLSPEQGAYVGVEVCRALDYAHRRMNVVHRDVTPRNVMIDEEGQVKVIDFGISAPAKAGGIEVFGSPGHMPPEQMRGEELGPATDIFAVAVLLMEAWTGAAPFRRGTPEDAEAAMRGTHPKPSDFDPRLAPLDDIVSRAMALDWKERPQSAEELGRALRKFLSGVDLADIARELGERVRRRRALMKPTPLGQPSRRKPLQSTSELETKTFARREEMARWESEAAPAPQSIEPSTRKIDEEQGTIETVATRPLETPVEEKTAARPKPRSLARWFIGAAALAGGIGLVVWRAQQSSHPTTIPTTSTTTTSATASVTEPLPAAPSAATSLTPSATVAAPATTSVVSNARAHLSLFGSVGTSVTIDGVPRGKVPIADFVVPPGDHEVVFTFGETMESVGKRVLVKEGDRVRLRADFTAATPTIQVER